MDLQATQELQPIAVRQANIQHDDVQGLLKQGTGGFFTAGREELPHSSAMLIL